MPEGDHSIEKPTLRCRAARERRWSLGRRCGVALYKRHSPTCSEREHNAA